MEVTMTMGGIEFALEPTEVDETEVLARRKELPGGRLVSVNLFLSHKALRMIERGIGVARTVQKVDKLPIGEFTLKLTESE